MKECEKIREWMTAYLAGELSPEDAAVLRVHLETCPACREEWKELSAAWNLTKSMLDSTAYDGTLPDGNRAEIRRAMNPRREFRIAPALWKIAAMFMVCGVILAVAVYSGDYSSLELRGEYIELGHGLLVDESALSQVIQRISCNVVKHGAACRGDGTGGAVPQKMQGVFVFVKHLNEQLFVLFSNLAHCFTTCS